MKNGSNIYTLLKRTLPILLIMLCSCNAASVNNGDWEYDLPNGYAVWRVNSRKIVCGIKTSEHVLNDVIDRFVLEFCYNDRYVALKCTEFQDDLSVEIDRENHEYYMIDTQTDQIYGAYTQSEWEVVCKNLSVTEFNAWISTSPMPQGATFGTEQ